MTHAYLLPIKTAALLFPLLALALWLPVAVLLYRRHGVMSHGRTLSLFAGLHYLLTAVCLTVVPLPAASVDVCRRYAAMSHPALTPGHTLADIAKEAHHRYGVAELALHNPATAGAVFNLLLLLPLGVLLRYHFRRGPGAAVAAGFALSLAFELTQGTGVWGLYPCPYRLLDIDDLLTNTAGAALGWLAAGPLTNLLPSLDVLDGKARARSPLPFGRRLAALLVDAGGFTLCTALTLLVLRELGDGGAPLETAAVLFALWFTLLPRLTGATPGKRLLRIELVTAGSGPPPLWRLTARALVLAAAVLPLWGLLCALTLLALDGPGPGALASYGGGATAGDAAGLLTAGVRHPRETVALALITGYSGLYAVTGLRGRGRPGLHERLSGIRCAPLPPTGRGAARPAGQPTARPAGQPQGPPAGRPTGRPKGQPSGRGGGARTGSAVRARAAAPHISAYG